MGAEAEGWPSYAHVCSLKVTIFGKLTVICAIFDIN